MCVDHFLKFESRLLKSRGFKDIKYNIPIYLIPVSCVSYPCILFRTDLFPAQFGLVIKQDHHHFKRYLTIKTFDAHLSLWCPFWTFGQNKNKKKFFQGDQNLSLEWVCGGGSHVTAKLFHWPPAPAALSHAAQDGCWHNNSPLNNDSCTKGEVGRDVLKASLRSTTKTRKSVPSIPWWQNMP